MSMSTHATVLLWAKIFRKKCNQLSEFKNAVLMAGILNRTQPRGCGRVVKAFRGSPRDPSSNLHHTRFSRACSSGFLIITLSLSLAVRNLGFLRASEIRVLVWNHSIKLLRARMYVSMADIVDITSRVSSSAVRVIDLRYLASLLCGVDLKTLCSGELEE
ncbi:hypothetical protein YC2023_086854 [Brassica napus]